MNLFLIIILSHFSSTIIISLLCLYYQTHFNVFISKPLIIPLYILALIISFLVFILLLYESDEFQNINNYSNERRYLRNDSL